MHENRLSARFRLSARDFCAFEFLLLSARYFYLRLAINDFRRDTFYNFYYNSIILITVNVPISQVPISQRVFAIPKVCEMSRCTVFESTVDSRSNVFQGTL